MTEPAGNRLKVSCGNWRCTRSEAILANPKGLTVEEIMATWKCGNGHPIERVEELPTAG